ncbi:hypothetical protein [Luteimonas mephitis]|uniref:hypothetical protein n=1 Tax=Luteimonas mephitis TaxID=83615 RepID=UPI00047DC449|nr:hypothetical protein [Luteimonas mephitis]
MDESRIPRLADDSRESVSRWFEQMYDRGLLFHPDDDPANIVCIADDSPTFTASECEELRDTIAHMLSCHGDDVYDIGLPFFLRDLPGEKRWPT